MRLALLLGLAGVLAGCDTFFVVEGTLSQCGTTLPIAGAEVTVMNDHPGTWDTLDGETSKTDGSGHFEAELSRPSSEAATVSFSKTGFASVSQDFPKGLPNWPYHMDFCLNAAPPP